MRIDAHEVVRALRGARRVVDEAERRARRIEERVKELRGFADRDRKDRQQLHRQRPCGVEIGGERAAEARVVRPLVRPLEGTCLVVRMVGRHLLADDEGFELVGRRRRLEARGEVEPGRGHRLVAAVPGIELQRQLLRLGARVEGAVGLEHIGDQRFVHAVVADVEEAGIPAGRTHIAGKRLDRIAPGGRRPGSGLKPTQIDDRNVELRRFRQCVSHRSLTQPCGRGLPSAARGARISGPCRRRFWAARR